tara:strand:+ start:1576 stop:2100 length:525 start_codon:yes stop_codon:yes gene_type:complete
MKQEQVEQIVAATDNLIAQSISDAIAEQFKKQNKTKVPANTNMFIGIAVVVVLIIALFAGFNNLGNKLNNTQDANTLTIVSAINAGDQNIVNGQADIIAGLDGVSVKMDGVIASNDKVIVETQKIAKKVDSLSSLLAKANKNTLHRYQSCLYNHVTVEKKLLADAVAICTKHLK